jgi:hypothetical protein
MKRSRFQFGLASLLAMPAMFGLGWWTRDRTYERDVYAAAEQMAAESGGVFIPDLGLFHGGQDLKNRMQSMSPQAVAELQRRLDYDTSVMSPAVGPPRPGFWASVKSLVGLEGDDDSYWREEDFTSEGANRDTAAEQSPDGKPSPVEIIRALHGGFGKSSATQTSSSAKEIKTGEAGK